MLVVGLTGSIGMGKSTTAGFFAARGVPVHDADACVHDLYAGAAVAPVEAEFPGVVLDGRIDRASLGQRVFGDAAARRRLEAIVHPLVRAAESRFLAAAARGGASMAVLDIPLLFETGAESRCRVVVVVTARAGVQRARVLSRPGMTVERFEAVLASQMPDAEKRRRAHALVDTGSTFAESDRQVEDIRRALAAMA